MALLSAIPIADPLKAAEQNRIRLTGEIPSPLAEIPACPFEARCPYTQDLCRTKRPELREIAPGHQVACHFARLQDWPRP